MHNPTLAFDRRRKQVAFHALRDFVDERGLEMPAESRCAAPATGPPKGTKNGKTGAEDVAHR